MPIKLQRWTGPGGTSYDEFPVPPLPWPTETLTAYTEAEEAAHIRQIVSLALAYVDPAGFNEEMVGRTIRAMGSAITSKGTSND